MLENKRKLTPKEIERCIKALNWKKKTDQVTIWYVDEKGVAQWREWEDGFHKIISLADVLFSRLWDRLCELAKEMLGEKAHVYIQLDALNYDKPFQVGVDLSLSGRPEDEYTSENDHPCPAMCEVIEKILADKKVTVDA